MFPGSDFDTAVTDTTNDWATVETMYDGTTPTAPGTADEDLCVERWTLSDTSVACVRMQGGATRNWDSGDTAEDIAFDYIEY